MPIWNTSGPPMATSVAWRGGTARRSDTATRAVMERVPRPPRARGAAIPSCATACASHSRMRSAERLVSLLVAPAISQEACRAAAALITAGLDWDRVLVQATRHRVLALLERGLVQAGLGDLPPVPFRRALGERVQALAFNSLMLSAMAAEVCRAFATAGIAVLVLKGPAVAVGCHGSLGLRPFSDIDLLVRRGDAAAAAALLEGLGYHPAAPLRPLLDAFDAGGFSTAYPCANENAYLAHDGRVCVDLHWGLHPKCLLLPGDDAGIWARSRVITILDAEFHTLSPIDTVIHLCIHAGRDGWKCLGHICDIAAWQLAYPGITRAAVCASAARQRCARLVHIGFALAAQVRGADGVAGQAATASADLDLATRLWRELFTTGPSAARRTLRALACALHLRDRPRDGLGQCLLTLRVALTRTAEGPLHGTIAMRGFFRLVSVLANAYQHCQGWRSS